jgi:hypothetical protein
MYFIFEIQGGKMPYIPKQSRPKFNDLVDAMVEKISSEEMSKAGELNYIITTLLMKFMKREGKRYHYYNMIAGVLTEVDKEIYRRFTAPYEDEKIESEGDLF